jgi:hypothetical protein
MTIELTFCILKAAADSMERWVIAPTISTFQEVIIYLGVILPVKITCGCVVFAGAYGTDCFRLAMFGDVSDI